MKPQILVTSKRKNCRGGLVHYAQVERDFAEMTKHFRDNDYEQHLFTTVFDFYALPEEFSGMDVLKEKCAHFAEWITKLETI